MRPHAISGLGYDTRTLYTKSVKKQRAVCINLEVEQAQLPPPSQRLCPRNLIGRLMDGGCFVAVFFQAGRDARHTFVPSERIAWKSTQIMRTWPQCIHFSQ